MRHTYKELLLAIICVLLIPDFSAALPVGISVDPGAKVVDEGQDFSINISIDPSNNYITAAQFNLIFNSSYLEVKNVTEGNLFKHDGANTTFNSGILNNSRGTLINVWGLIITPGINVTTKESLAMITMHAKVSGNSQLNFSNVIVSYPDSQAAQVNITNGSVLVVTIPGKMNADLNDDGNVTKLDLDIIKNNFGKVTSMPYPKYDVNADGIVNVKDATLVSNQI